MIDETGALCTSALVDRHLRGRFRAWAVVGAFGDNLEETAVALARPLELDADRLARLRELGASLNYNAYGSSIADVLVPPLELYRIVSHYEDPFEMAEREPVAERLAAERRADLLRALASPPVREDEGSDAYVLPDAPWSRRERHLRQSPRHGAPDRAHAVLTPVPGGGYAVSVRAPREAGLSACGILPALSHGRRADPRRGHRPARGGAARALPRRVHARLARLGLRRCAGARRVRRSSRRARPRPR